MSAKISLPFRDFQSALKRVAVATSKDDARPVLQTVQVIASPARVRLQSADGFRLHRVDLWDDAGTWCDYEDIALQFAVLLSPEQIKHLLKVKIARKDTPFITIDPEAGTVALDGKPTPGTFDTESKYPDVDYIFSKDRPALQVKVKTSDLLAAVKTARVYSKQGSNAVQLHISDSIVVYAKSEETGESWTVVTPEHLNRVRSHDIVIAFNADYLVEYLKNAGETVRLDLWTPVKPAVFQDGAGNDYTALVMPMLIDAPHRHSAHDIPCLTPEDIPTPAARPDRVTAVFDLETGEFIRDPQDVEYTEAADAWKLQHTVTHDPEFGTVCKTDPNNIPWVSSPEPGAVTFEIGTIHSYELDAPTYGKNPHEKLIAFHLTNPQPDPSAPIAVDWTFPVTRHPVFDAKSITIGECSRCIDPNPHALIDDLCSACREEIKELASH